MCVCVCARYEMLQDNVGGYRKEIALLREKTQKQAASGQKSEQSVHTLTQDLRAANEKLSMVEVSVFMLLNVLLFQSARYCSAAHLKQLISHFKSGRGKKKQLCWSSGLCNKLQIMMF